MKTFPSLSRPLLRRPGRNLLSLTLWAGLAAGLEVVGRRTPTDFADAAALVAVAVAVVLTWRWHRQSPLPWVQAVWRRARALRERMATWRTEFGVDFRGQPAVAAALPPVLWKPTLVLFGLVGLLLPLRAWLPGGARALLIQGSYLGWLLLLGLVWAASTAAVLSMLFQVHGHVHDLFVKQRRADPRRLGRGEALVHMGLLLVGGLCWAVLPVAVALAIAGLASAAILGVLLLPRRPRLPLLWRTAADRQVHAMELKPFLALQFTAVGLALFALVLLTRGAHLTRSADLTSMPLTSLMGVVLAWAFAAGTIVMAWRILRLVLLERIHDPSAPVAPTLHLSGAPPGAGREALRERMGVLGWRLRFAPEARRPTDVPVRVVAAAAPGPEDPFSPGWPRSLTWEDLDQPDQLWRYRRRWEVQCRRLLLRGLKKLFRHAERQRFRQGEGYWLGAQHWFVAGLTRDRQEQDPDLQQQGILDPVIGPPYHRLLPREARHHFHQVMKDLEVDLLFVQDGLRYRRWRKVLESLFELHDRHGGRERAEERHFTGLPGIRVILHEFSLVTPPRRDRYPEPHYEDIGRARILHVFRDRGGDPSLPTVPVDLEWIPAGTF